MNIVSFQKGTPIFRQGQPGACMYEVMRGTVGIYAGWGTEEQRLLTEVAPGGQFGEMAIVDSSPRSADAVSLAEDTALLEISERELLNFLLDRPDRVLQLMKTLSARLRALTADYTEVCAAISRADEMEKVKKERLWKRLLHFAGIFDRNKAGANSGRPLKFTPPEYADAEARMVGYGEKAVIFAQGDRSRELYIVRKGRVGIYTGYGGRDEKHLVTLEPGSYFGEMGLIDAAPRSATAIALEPKTRLERIRPEELDKLMQSSPEVILDILRNLSARLRKLTQEYLEACRAASTVVAAVDRDRELNAEAKKLISFYASSQNYTNYY